MCVGRPRWERAASPAASAAHLQGVMAPLPQLAPALALACFGMLYYALVCFSLFTMFCYALLRHIMFWHVLLWFTMFWYVLGCVVDL